MQPFEELEAEMLNGQKLQGPLTAKEVYEYLEKEGKIEQYVILSSTVLMQSCVMHGA